MTDNNDDLYERLKNDTRYRIINMFHIYNINDELDKQIELGAKHLAEQLENDDDYVHLKSANNSNNILAENRECLFPLIYQNKFLLKQKENFYCQHLALDLSSKYMKKTKIKYTIT